jgi:dipeptidyl aminopeptidase/acylaminoacyl peptidase
MTPRPFGSWPSPLDARDLVAGVVGLSQLRTDGSRLLWLESRPEEGGRTTIMSLDGTELTELTPAPVNVRSRVHEYGGGAYCAGRSAIFFVDFAGQNLHRIGPGGQIEPITDSDSGTRFADFVEDPEHNRLITVVEVHREEGEPENYLAAVDLGNGQVSRLEDGHDFYAAPRLSGDGRLVFIAWDHPNMPWDGTVLKTAEFDETGALTKVATIAGGSRESVVQPVWQEDGSLLFMSDANGFWNLYRYDESGIYCVFEDGADYADPPWVFGQTGYASAGHDHVLLTRHGAGYQEVVMVNTRTTLGTPLVGEDSPWCGFDSLTVLNGALHFIGSRRDSSPTIERLPLDGSAPTRLRESGGPSLAPEQIARAEALEFPTRDGGHAHAYFYPPTHPEFSGLPDERPPLLVMGHGGPTSATSPALNLRIQYYTSRGWSVVDVDYRGSTGYGRSYRDALNGQWGILDVTDCEDAVRSLAAAGRIDPDRVAIRGGSAGGYTTLAALTTTPTFRAGASHYGIGDLTALANDTHKFESRYLDGLLGTPEALTERSPINHLERLSCPVIFFQGTEDRVVPPNQSRAMADALKGKGIPVACLEFEGEGHGFRSADNIVRATEAEYAFFCRVFGIQAADGPVDLPIDNRDALPDLPGAPGGDQPVAST